MDLVSAAYFTAWKAHEERNSEESSHRPALLLDHFYDYVNRHEHRYELDRRQMSAKELFDVREVEVKH
eukprot:1570704-Amphidinium_carterae.1